MTITPPAPAPVPVPVAVPASVAVRARWIFTPLLTTLLLVLILLPPLTMPAMGGKELEGRRVLMVIAPEGYREEELSVPQGIFRELGAEVVVASTRRGIARGMFGGEVNVNITIGEVNLSDYDAIVIAGGAGSRQYLWDDNDLRALVTAAYEDNKPVGAICISPVVLARAGILKDKECTAYHAVKDELINAGARYKDEGVVVSGNIITAKGPKEAIDFAIAISEVMMNKGYRPSPSPSPMLTPKPGGFGFGAMVAGVAAVLALLRQSKRRGW